jgi:hypothetical protein
MRNGTQNFGWKDNFGDLGLHGRILLKLRFKTGCGGGIGLKWLF